MKRLVIILAGVFMLGTAAVVDGQTGQCVTRLTGLTAQQTEKINKLNEKHQQVIDGLRTDRRSTTNLMEKDKIRATMLNEKEAHFASLKQILTAEQWTEFESIYQSNLGNGQGRNASGNRNGVRRGNGNWNGKGRNSGYRSAGNCIRTSNTSNVGIYTNRRQNFNFINQ